ncbi:MAG: methylcobamide--CoM methyltransferase MtbA [Deltaproteobacteria bacterium]|nr:methylcobamide--CoM methyltransferase MtbA [Deltaproteobacteria bacterium]
MTTMTSAERLGTAMSHKEADRVPFLLPTIMQGARELGLTIEEYFAKAENVAEGQMRLLARYRHDGVFGFMYAAQEIEAFGGTTVFRDDGPANAGEPPVDWEDIPTLEPPRVDDCPALVRVLKIIELLASRLGGTVPILGVALSPYSLPTLQLGMESYLALLYERPDLAERLMRVNEEFCVAWSNAQLAAGAGAIAYTDPMASPSITPLAMYRRFGHPAACRTLERLKGAAATGLASGRAIPIIDDLVRTGTVGVSASVHEDLAEMKAACRGRLTVMGNLNAIEMRSWTLEQTVSKVREAIEKGAPGGGFVLTDNHGEIPWQVPEDVLQAVCETVFQFGRYPIRFREE